MNRPRFLVAALAAAVVLGAGSFTAGFRLATNEEGSSGYGRIEDAAERLRREAARPVTVEELVRGAIRGMLAVLDDPYAAYLDPDQTRQVDDLISGSFVGIGVWLETVDGGLRVTSVLADSPAERAGLGPGDLIVKAAGRSMAGVDIDKASDLIRGPVGSTVELVVSSDGRERTVEVRREEVSLADVQARMIRGRIAYAHPMQFGRGMATRLREELARLLEAGADAIVLDLRGNRGGLAGEAVDTASLFLDGGVVATIREPGGPEDPLLAEGTPLARDVPMALLVDGGTASASELVAGALQDHERAVVVGTRTFGKGSVLTVGHLGEGAEAIQFTSAFFFTPDGRRIEGRGIEPDIPVLPGGSGDPQLERAVRAVLDEV